MITDSKIFARFLTLLEIEPAKPSLDLLKQIVSSHLEKIPFENISKLIFKRQGMYQLPSFEKYLDGIEHNNLGGTCYSINYYLNLLLRYFDYDVKLCGADMNNPDVHIISMVNLDGTEFIVDCGYAAPFLEPLPRNLEKDYTLKSGNETYILKPKDSRGNSRVEQYYKDELKHFYIAKPQPRDQKEFKKVIKDSYNDEALFMNSLLVTRHSSDHSVILRNFTLTVIKGSEVKQKTISKTEIPDTVNKYFGIPARLVKSAIFGLRQLAD